MHHQRLISIMANDNFVEFSFHFLSHRPPTFHLFVLFCLPMLGRPLLSVHSSHIINLLLITQCWPLKHCEHGESVLMAKYFIELNNLKVSTAALSKIVMNKPIWSSFFIRYRLDMSVCVCSVCTVRKCWLLMTFVCMCQFHVSNAFESNGRF